MTALRQRMLEDLQIRQYSPTTIRIYLHAVAEFAQHFGKRPDQLGPEHIRRYQLFLIKEKKISRFTCIQVVCALRFFYTHTLGRKIAIERIPFPRRERKLALILNREEVKALLEAPRSLRHRALLAILGTGRPCCRPSFWHCCVATGEPGGRPNGCSPELIPLARSPLKPSFWRAGKPGKELASPSPFIRTLYGMLSRRTCWKRA